MESDQQETKTSHMSSEERQMFNDATYELVVIGKWMQQQWKPGKLHDRGQVLMDLAFKMRQHLNDTQGGLIAESRPDGLFRYEGEEGWFHRDLTFSQRETISQHVNAIKTGGEHAKAKSGYQPVAAPVMVDELQVDSYRAGYIQVMCETPWRLWLWKIAHRLEHTALGMRSGLLPPLPWHPRRKRPA